LLDVKQQSINQSIFNPMINLIAQQNILMKKHIHILKDQNIVDFNPSGNTVQPNYTGVSTHPPPNSQYSTNTAQGYGHYQSDHSPMDWSFTNNTLQDVPFFDIAACLKQFFTIIISYV
jgi:hypothetical protein